jgi:hypothetical protein
MNWGRNLMMGCVMCFGFVAQIHAAPVLVPPSLSPGSPYHLVFVSSTRSTASLGGIAGADLLVQTLADTAGIGVTQGITWQAVLSDSTTNAISRFNPSAPIYDLQGNRVAVSGPALWNTASVALENPILFDETGVTGTFIEVWTGTTAAGTLQQADSNWATANSNDSATSGIAGSTTSTWMEGLPTSELVQQSIYAVSSQLIAPATSAPEPTTCTLAILGLLSLGMMRRRRRS